MSNIFFIYIQDLFRNAIEEQIKEVKDEWFKDKEWIECSVTKLKINRQICHADHYPTNFSRLVWLFLWGKEWIFPEDIEPIDKTIKEWQDYHLSRTKLNKNGSRGLRPTYSKVNLRLKKDQQKWFIPNKVNKLNQFEVIQLELNGYKNLSKLEEVMIRLRAESKEITNQDIDEAYGRKVIITHPDDEID